MSSSDTPRRPRLLLVEHGPTADTEFASALEEAGYEVSVVPDAERAWESVSTATPDVLVSDLLLPGASGIDLCRRVKAEARTRRVPVVLRTGEADPLSVLRSLEAGADGYLTRDLPSDALVERVRRARRRSDDGKDRPAEVDFLGHSFTVRLSPGRLLGMLLSALEDGLRLKERLRETDAGLRRRHDALARANQALRDANEVKERFLRAAAHDLRNPAGVVRSIAELILDGDAGPVSDDQKDLLGRVVRQAQALLDQLQDLLDVSAIRAGKLELDAKVQDPKLVLRDAFETAQTAASAKGIELAWNVPAALPATPFDFRRIQEVLGNLLSNAIKFSAAGAHVTLGATGGDGELSIRVTDDGPGIPENEIDELFEPFAELSNRPTAGEPSTGLGLSIVKEIVERHHGTIEVESRVGEGSTFRVRLPLHEGER